MVYLNLLGYVCIPLAYLVHYWLGKGNQCEPVVTFALAGLGVMPSRN